MKKGWAKNADEDEGPAAAQEAREAAAAVTGRGATNLRLYSKTMHAKADEPAEAQGARDNAAKITGRRRRSPLYDRTEPEED